MKTNYLDIIFIILLAGTLLVLEALGWLNFVMKFPFEIALVSYFTGRYVSNFFKRRKAKTLIN